MATQKAIETTKQLTPASPIFVEAEKLFEQMKEFSQSVARRAYEFFEERGREFGHDLENWFRAQNATNTSLDELFHLPPEGAQLESVEMSLVEQAMKRSGGNQMRAAELLSISRDQLRYRLRKLEGTAIGALD